ncbi:MAG: translocation/assembly module TamB domain-containing protein, partial [Proteobacteria bacterium]|nr:translocation/assembly module TamB domain-containing protein [Pseudomonadota bacterium]
MTVALPAAGKRRWPLRLLGAVLLGPLLLVLLGWGAINLPLARHGLAGLVADAISGPGMSVSIGAISGPLPQAPVLRDITVADDTGPWLRIDTLSLAWRPLDLMKGALTIERLAAGHVAVARLPELPVENAAKKPTGIPRLPFAVRDDALAVASLDLGAAVLGEAAVFAIDGQAAAPRAGIIETRLDIRRLDAGQGGFQLRAAIDTGVRSLHLEAQVNEPANGLAATLIGLPGRPALRLALVGDGAIDAWKGRLDAEAEGLLTVEADVGVDAAVLLNGAGALRTTVEGRVFHHLDIGPEANRLFGETVSVSADTGLDLAEWRLNIHRLALTGRAVVFEATGSLALDSLEMNIETESRLTDPGAATGLFPDLRLAALTARATLNGTLARPRMILHAEAENVLAGAIGARSLTIDATASPDGNPAVAMAIEGRAMAAGLTGPPTEAVTLVGADISARLRGRMSLADGVFDIANLNIAVASLAADGAGSISLDTGQADLSLTARLADLAPLSIVTGIDLAGRASAQIFVRGDVFTGDIGATVAGTIGNLRAGPPDIAAALGGNFTFATDVRGNSNGVWSVRDFALDGDGMALAANADIDPGAATVGASFGLRLVNIERLSSVAGIDLAGTLDVTGTLAGPFDAMRLDANARLADGRTSGIAWTRLSAAMDLGNLPAKPQGRVELSGDGAHGPITAAARVDTGGDGGLRLDDIRATGAGLNLSGRLRLPIDGTPVTGLVKAEATSLAAIAALAGFAADGSGTVAAELTALGGEQRIAATAKLQRLTLHHGADTVSLESLDVDLKGRGDAANPDLTATIAGRGLQGSGARLQRIDVTAEGGLADGRFTVSLTGDQPVAATLNLSGSAQRDGAGFVVALNSLAGDVAGRALSLRQAASLRYGAGGLFVEGVDLAAADGRLTAGLALTDATVDAALTATDMPIDLLRLAVPEAPVAGRWNASLKLSGSPARPDGSLSVTVDQVTFGDPSLRDLPPLAAVIEGQLQAGLLRLDGHVSGLPETRAAVVLEVPLRLSAQPFTASIPEGAEIGAHLIVDGDIGPVWQLLPLDPHQLSGRVTADLAIAGPLDSIQASGQAAVSGGRYENLESGTLLIDVALELAGDGTGFKLVRASAGDGQGGSLTASGGIDLAPGRAKPIDLSVAMTALRLIQRDEITATASGNIAFSGTLAAPRLTGAIVTDLIEIQLTDNLPPQVVTLEVVEVGGEGPEP